MKTQVSLRLALLVSLFPFFSAFAQKNIGIKSSPSWVDPISYGNIEMYNDSVGEGYYFPVQDYQVNVAQKTSYYHYVRKIINERGVQNSSEIQINFDPSYEKLFFHGVKIIRKGQSINKLDLSKVQILQKETQQNYHIYNGVLSALLVLEDIRADDVLEYSFSIEGSNPIYKGKFFDSFYLQFYDPSIKIYRSIIIPNGRKLSVKSQFASDPVVIKNAMETKYVWNLDNITGYHAESDIPSWYDPYPAVWISEYQSWQELIEWALEIYNTSSSEKPGSSLLNKINEIKKQYPDQESQLSAALRFVQDSIRYTGMENGVWGIKPFSPNKVFNLRYGDCKGKSLLLCWLLRNLNIQAYPALVNSRLRQEISNQLPAPVAFDHCIVMVTLNGKQYWYDATQSLQRGGHDNIYIANYKWALVLKPGNQDLTKIEVATVSRIKTIERFFIDTVGKGARLNVETQYEGYDADVNRTFFQNNTLKKIEEDYLNYYRKNFAFIKSAALPAFTDDETNNLFSTHEEYLIDSLWIAPDTNVRSAIEASFYAEGLFEKLRSAAEHKRKSPFQLEYPMEYDYTIEIHLPERWNVENDFTEIKSPGFIYTREIIYEDNIITIHHILKTTEEYIEAQQVQEYNKNVTNTKKYVGYSLQYNNGSSQSRSGFNWPILLLMLLSAALSFLICRRIYHLDPTPAEGYIPEKQIGGWLILFAIGICLSPFRLIYDIYKNQYFDDYGWSAFISHGASSVDFPILGYNSFTLITNIFLLSLSILLITVFMQRRSNTPFVVNLFYVYNVTVLIVDIILMGILDLISNDPNPYISVFTNVIRGVIWILYFRLSHRAKRTFVERYKKESYQEDFEYPAQEKAGTFQ